MFKFLSMAMLAVCCFAFQGKAAGGVALVVPYKVKCVKKPDGTEVIQVSALLRKTKKGLVVNELVSNQYRSDDPTFPPRSSETTILQAKESCEELDARLAEKNTINGFPVHKISNDEQYTFSFPSPNQNLLTFTDLCVYFADVSSCTCLTPDTDFAKKFLHVDDTDQLAWVPLDYVLASDDNTTDISIVTLFQQAPYSTDALLRTENFDSGDRLLRLEDYLIRLAMQRLHGTACCFPSFGMDDESVNALTLQIIEKMETCPQDFSATGTWGSCGDTARVKVTGTMTKPIIIDVCGKKLCFTPLNNQDLNPTQKFEIFYRTFPVFNDATFLKCGRQDALCQLVKGITQKAFLNQLPISEFFYQLRLVCIDNQSNTYGFILIKSGYNNNSEKDEPTFQDIGARFKLEDCPKCCK